MSQPSSSPSATEHSESEKTAPLMELIQIYRVEQAMLIAHQREVERRRAAVRAAAEQEASEILLAARREIRRVLVRTRQELAMLTAQLRAVGCEPESAQSEQPIFGEDFELSAARDVRKVLREARSELAKLSDNPANVSPAAEEPQLLATAEPTAPAPERAVAIGFTSAPAFEVGDAAADSSEEMPATGRVAQFVARWRTAAIGLVIVAVAATAIVALRRSSSNEPAVARSQPEPVASTADAPANQAAGTQRSAASAAAIDASEKAGSSEVSLTLEVRRPVWLRINADGAVDPGRTYQPGERRTIQATREILLRAGDAGAVSVSLAGGALAPLGPDGQVRTRRFGRGGGAGADQASQDLTPALVSQVGPQTPAVATVGVGTEATAPPAATETPSTAAGTPAPEQAAEASERAAMAEREILERHQRWFEAFERGDHATMASLATDNFTLVDQRAEPAPAVSGRVERLILDLRVQVTAGVGAVVSGRIAETTTAGDGPAATVAMLSEVWVRRGEEWRLVSVRMVPVNGMSTSLP